MGRGGGLSPHWDVRDPGKFACGSACWSSLSGGSQVTHRTGIFWGLITELFAAVFLNVFFGDIGTHGGIGSSGLNPLVLMGILEPTLKRQWDWGS